MLLPRACYGTVDITAVAQKPLNDVPGAHRLCLVCQLFLKIGQRSPIQPLQWRIEKLTGAPIPTPLSACKSNGNESVASTSWQPFSTFPYIYILIPCHGVAAHRIPLAITLFLLSFISSIGPVCRQSGLTQHNEVLPSLDILCSSERCDCAVSFLLFCQCWYLWL